jgi:hypothetical protein
LDCAKDGVRMKELRGARKQILWIVNEDSEKNSDFYVSARIVKKNDIILNKKCCLNFFEIIMKCWEEQ